MFKSFGNDRKVTVSCGRETVNMMQPHEDETDLSMLCRRRVPRIVMPIEVKLQCESRCVLSMIRDASIDETAPEAPIGVGLYHGEVLPLGVPIHCEVLSDSDELPRESTLILMWTRNFDADGFLSGGRLEHHCPAAETPPEDTP